MAYGVGGAIAEGLRSGFDLARQVDLDKAKKEQTEFENARQTAADARAARAADLAASHQALQALQLQRGEHAAEGAGLLKQYGAPEAIPVDIANDYATRGQAYTKQYRDTLQKIAGPVQDYRQKAQDDASRMQTGQLDPLDPKYSPTDLVHTLTATARRPLQDFIGTPDQPAPVKQMVADFRTGLQTGNEGLTLKAVNGLFEPELKSGLGQPSPHGGVIVGKQIVKLVPAPSDPNNPNDPNAGKVTPVLRVFVREGPAQNEGANYSNEGRTQGAEQTQFGAPPGATGHYDAPVTQNRSTDPNDPIAHISMEDAMNRIGQMETLAASMEHPELRAKVEEGMKAAGDTPNAFLRALYASGGNMPAKQETYENVQIGPRGVLRITKNAQGVETGREVIAPPEGTGVGQAPGPLAKKLRDIEASDLSDADKAKAKQVAAGVAKVATPKAGATGTGLGGGKTGGASAVLGTAPPGGASDKSTVDFWSRAVIAGDKDWQVGLSRSKTGSALIEAVKRRVPGMADELGLTPQDLGTTRATSAALSATLKDLTKRSAAVDMFSSKVEKDMQTFDQVLADAGSNSPLLINKPINALRRQFSDPDLSRLDLAARQVGTEYERLITGGTLSVAQLHAGAQEDAKKLINGDMPPKQARAIMDQMRVEMRNARDAAHESSTRIQDQMRGLGKGNTTAPTKTPTGATVSNW